MLTVGALGLTCAFALGACAVEDALVGVNAGSGGGGPGGTGGDGVSGHDGVTGGTGASAGHAPAGVSVSYSLVQIRTEALDKCLGRTLPVEPSGTVACRVYAAPGATRPPSEADYACDAPGRGPVEPAVRASVLEYFRSQGQCSDSPDSNLQPCADVCLCDVHQAEGPSLENCQREIAPPPNTHGWCYVAPEQGVGVPELVAECPDYDRHRLIFRGDAVPRDELFVLACATTTVPNDVPVVVARFGDACVPADEYRIDFGGFSVSDVTIERDSPACEDSGVCVVNHFQGRTICPYGQTAEELAVAPSCFLPSSNVTVTVPVEPQSLERRAAKTAICSCRCDGPGDGPFCSCPSDMQCTELVRPLGLASDDAVVGSYCIPKDTEYDPQDPGNFELCNADTTNCDDPRPY
ncbi:MAG TPA: hypothetical protein VGK73_26785 [Polyangiaceae bacterium]